MKISTKSRYALRFMIDLAERWGEGPQSMREIADRQGVSKKYLEQIVAPLASNGLIVVSRGHAGGYELSRAPELITMADVMKVTEDGLGLLACIDDPNVCDRFSNCRSVQAWSGLQNVMIEYLSSRTLKDLGQFGGVEGEH